ncbi:MAG TPA: VWA domain-containing protein, partial [Chloroflexota bacterium]|nr:VWA domain-containing protein [Chloroflexota bacterium]
WLNGYVNLSTRRSRIALAARLALLAAVILGLAGASLNLPQTREAVVVVADLSASDSSAQSSMQGFINAVARRRPDGNELGVVSVGRDARVEQPPSPLTTFDGFQTTVDRNSTNLDGGLSLAGAILPDGYRRRITILTDGQQNVGEALATARLERSIGVRVDVLPIHVAGGPEVLVDSVTMPSQLRPQERFSIDVAVRSTVNTTTDLVLYRDHSLAISRREVVRAGENHYVFAQPPLSPGTHTYLAQIDPALDTERENNQGSAFTLVASAPRVLVISPGRAEAANVLASLYSTGIKADFAYPQNVIPTLSFLQRYAAVVLVDTPVDALDPDLVSELVPYVRDLGHGLVVIGGRESYGMGGYGQTALEQALPVKMDLPKRKDLPSAAVVLIIENLESDAQVNISKQAGKGVVGLLTQQDQIAVSDATGGQFVVPLQHATNKAAIDHEIDQMQPGDPISYVADLQAAYQTLRNTRARVKHIILLGDGDAEDPAYQHVAKAIRAGGVTISTVATNGLGFNDFQTIQNIAKWGGGRYYRGDNTSAIPSIFLHEARTVARSGIVEGKFYPQELSASPLLTGISAVPPLTGYVATTPKPTGEMVLVSKKLDPVLAAWQFGLGRSVAWTSDAAGLWTADWLQAPGANRFWANLVSWTLPAAQGGKLFINADSSGGQGHVSVDTPPSLGANPGVTAHILGPDLRAATVQLQPSAPGHFTGSFLANTEGPYFISVDARGASHSEAGETGLDVPYSAEYRTTGTDLPFIRALASAGGGSVVSGPDSAWQDNLASVNARQSLAAWLWLLALLLLPIDIGIRRLVVTRADLAAIRDAIAGFRRPSLSGAPLFAPLGTLLRQRAERAQSIRERPASSTVRPSLRPATASPQKAPPNGPGRPKVPKQAARSTPASSAPNTPATTAPAKPASAAPTAPARTAPATRSAEPEPASTASRLLAAKRRRQ